MNVINKVINKAIKKVEGFLRVLRILWVLRALRILRVLRILNKKITHKLFVLFFNAKYFFNTSISYAKLAHYNIHNIPSSKFSRSHKFKLHRSKLYFILMLGCHSVVLAIILVSSISHLLFGVIILTWVLVMFFSFRRYFLQLKCTEIHFLDKQSDQKIYIVYLNNRYEVSVVDDVLVHRWLCLIPLSVNTQKTNIPKCLTLPIFFDSLEKNEYRRLKVLLKFY